MKTLLMRNGPEVAPQIDRLGQLRQLRSEVLEQLLNLCMIRGQITIIRQIALPTEATCHDVVHVSCAGRPALAWKPIDRCDMRCYATRSNRWNLIPQLEVA